ncbi:MAG: hypothetical protein MK135_07320 [Polyangiaceae bacterium]|nr:hypothetical protein [Polyangiaceae bacterium]
MTESKLEQEIAQLRAEVEEMKKAQSGPPESSEAKESPLLRAGEFVEQLAENVDFGQASSQVQTVVKELGQEMKESRPRPLLVAFALGFVAAKILSRR